MTVTEVHGQWLFKNLQGRSARLDIFASDKAGKVYNIEVQRSDRGAIAKRARYNAALIDANITEPGAEYEALNESYVIFITENDVIGDNLPLYHAERVITETGKIFGDEQHIIYVNSQIRDESALGRLMHDMWCVEADDMHYHILADRVRYFKEDQEGVATMCRAMEEMRNETQFRQAVEFIKVVMSRGFSAEGAMEFLKIPTDEYQKYMPLLNAEK